MKKHTTWVPAVVLASAMALTGCARTSTASGDGDAAGSAGVVPTADCPPAATQALADGEKITLGVTLAQSGPVAVVDNMAKAMNAVFEEANAAGGIDGHEIEFVVKDDAFETARAVTNVRQLIDSEGVMALVGQVGTPLVAATQPFVERSCTPQLWVSSGVEELAFDPQAHPFTTSTLIPYETEAAMWVEALKTGGLESGKIAMINADDDRATAFEKGVTKAIEGSDFQLAGSEKVSASAPSVDAQVNATLAKDPDAVLVGTSTGSCPPIMTGLRRAGFKGPILVNSTCSAIVSNFVPAGKAANGVQVLTFTDDPSNPALADDPEVKEYRKLMAKYAPDADADSSYTASGYQNAKLTLAALSEAAQSEEGLSRVSIMNAAWTVDAEVPMGPKGAKATLNWTEDSLWRDQVQLMEYQHGKGLRPVGDVLTVQ